MWNLAEDTIDQSDLDALADWVIKKPRLTQGKLVAEFEESWSAWLGCRSSVMVGSGTDANLAMMIALGLTLKRPPRVGVSAVTWSTNLSPSILLGHKLRVFDVARETLGADPQQVLHAVENNLIDALFVTHLLGFDALLDEIIDACNNHEVLILEDCCEAHGTKHHNKKVGTLGLASSFSFYFGHHMSTIEGGIVSTNDPEFANLVRLIRSHGLARESEFFESYAADYPEIDPRFLFIIPGLNLRSSDLNAFLGLRQLARLDNQIKVRNENLDLFLDTAPIDLFRDFKREGVSSFALPIITNSPDARLRVVAKLRELGIEYRPIVAGNLLKQPFVHGIPLTAYSTPNADWVHDNGVYVGNGSHVSGNNIRTLTNELRMMI